MEDLTISQVAAQLGIRTSTIRYYESIAVLPPPRRANGRRRYDPSVIERLSFIQVAQALGFTLAEIQLLVSDRSADDGLAGQWQSLARQKLADVDRLIQHAQDVRRRLVQGLRCGCPNLSACINCVLAHCHGPAQT
ncbi:MAG TPA: MerR family transcriptional regulator [Herpetosiphonaceae bacterium]|nr:MerR family transcriptional regulator [Herpetosiphonaceae bacterium]